MNRRFFLKSMPIAVASVSTVVAKTVVAETEKEWLEFADKMPEPDSNFKIKNHEFGDIRTGELKKYNKHAIFLLRKVSEHQSTNIDKREWKEWSWRYEE